MQFTEDEQYTHAIQVRNHGTRSQGGQDQHTQLGEVSTMGTLINLSQNSWFLSYQKDYEMTQLTYRSSSDTSMHSMYDNYRGSFRSYLKLIVRKSDEYNQHAYIFHVMYSSQMS